MDLRALQLFQHLATTLHFGDTAQAMFVSPSTLSRVIQRLEEECGSELFTRDNRKVALTHAGETLSEFAKTVLSQWDEVRDRLQQDSHILQGELSLYCSVTASQSHLPNLLQLLSVRYPHVKLKLQTGDPALSIKQVANKQVDVALAIRPPNLQKDIYFLPLDDVPLVLIVPKQWRIHAISMIDWTMHPVVMPEKGYARDIVDKWFNNQQITPKIYASVGGNEAIVSMVSLGCGIGFVPQIVLDHSTAISRVNKFIPKDVEPYKLGLCCLSARQHQPLVKALFNLAAKLSY